jgi:hypothetical protein
MQFAFDARCTLEISSYQVFAMINPYLKKIKSCFRILSPNHFLFLTAFDGTLELCRFGFWGISARKHPHTDTITTVIPREP